MRPDRLMLVGIALSLFWAVGAVVYQRNQDLERADRFAKWAYQSCVEKQVGNKSRDLTSCDQEREKTHAIWMSGSWGNIAFFSLGPIPFAWLAVAVLVTLARVQVAGFRAVLPWSTLTRKRKALVIFTSALAGVLLLFGSLAVLNSYADGQVPVSLSPGVLVSKLGDDFVSARGTWVRSGRGGQMADALQTSNIFCHRHERRCSESRASVANRMLVTDQTDYDIVSWSRNAIVFKNAFPCAEEVFTIDLNTESVSGAGRLTNQNMDYCKGGSTASPAEERWSYRLSDGFQVYWSERQKARPMPLRVIQAIFGN